MAKLWRSAVMIAAVGLCPGIAGCQGHETLPTNLFVN